MNRSMLKEILKFVSFIVGFSLCIALLFLLTVTPQDPSIQEGITVFLIIFVVSLLFFTILACQEIMIIRMNRRRNK